jgi:hypothetical protein
MLYYMFISNFNKESPNGIVIVCCSCELKGLGYELDDRVIRVRLPPDSFIFPVSAAPRQTSGLIQRHNQSVFSAVSLKGRLKQPMYEGDNTPPFIGGGGGRNASKVWCFTFALCT